MPDDIQIDLGGPPALPTVSAALPFVDRAIKRIKQIGDFRSGQPLIFVTPAALQKMKLHAAQHARRGEVGGMLAGRFCTHGDVFFVSVEVAIPSEKAVTSPGSLHFTLDAIDECEVKREQNWPSLTTVGYYHSHPGFGVFVSGMDVHTHETRFADGPFVAFVLEPFRDLDGAFGLVDGAVVGPLAYWLVES